MTRRSPAAHTRADVEKSACATMRLRWILLAALLMTACSTPPPAKPKPAEAALSACEGAAGQGAAQSGALVETLRRGVEAGPLYKIPAGAGVAACRVSAEGESIAVDYTFSDGGSLHVNRDPRIELIEQEARFVLPAAEEPEDVLSRAERTAFGAKGCGIDWSLSRARPVGDTGAMEIVFGSRTCNCQATIRRDSGKRVIGLSLRSTC